MGRFHKNFKRHIEHRLRRANSRSDTGLYRSRSGVLLGVFKGLADYFDLSVKWLRLIGIVIFIFSGFWPIGALYLLAALIMKPEPVIPFETADETEFYESYTHSRKGAVNRMKRKFDNLNRRIQRMEDIVTDREFDWEQRLNS